MFFFWDQTIRTLRFTDDVFQRITEKNVIVQQWLASKEKKTFIFFKLCSKVLADLWL